MQEVFTTGQAGKICGISGQTIIRCFDRGQIKGFRVPGSSFRRIPRAALIEFMQEHGLSTERIDLEQEDQVPAEHTEYVKKTLTNTGEGSSESYETTLDYFGSLRDLAAAPTEPNEVIYVLVKLDPTIIADAIEKERKRKTHKPIRIYSKRNSVIKNSSAETK